MPLEWTPLLATDVPEIDEQHKELFRRIALFSEAVGKGRGPAEVAQMVEFMESYAELHLSTEEVLLEKIQFPQFAAHKGHHDYFRRNIAAIKGHLAARPAEELVGEIYTTLTMWLLAHIKKMDLAWAVFLKSKQQ